MGKKNKQKSEKKDKHIQTTQSTDIKETDSFSGLFVYSSGPMGNFVIQSAGYIRYTGCQRCFSLF